MVPLVKGSDGKKGLALANPFRLKSVGAHDVG